MDTAPAQFASQFRELAERYRELARRTATHGHLASHVFDRDVQAARLLLRAIEAGLFPRAQAERNGAWWDLRIGRWPGAAVAQPAGAPLGSSDAEAPSSAQLALCWTFAVGSWLVRRFPERFRDDAARWDWQHAATDQEGRFLGTDGKPLRYRWYMDGEPLPDGAEVPAAMEGRWECRMESDIAYESSSYDRTDWLEHQRARADVHADACSLLADLFSPLRASAHRRSKRRGRKVAAPKIERPLTAIETRTLEVVARHRQNFSAAASELGRAAKTVRENYERAMAKMSRLLGQKGRSASTTALPTDRRGQIDVHERGG